ncbi:sensor histidine kinase [Streptomyces sp. NPDC007264]|uniref:sensor histidine kinase n=1 Tax=Streptomyces sp. NPDC007264 TaxID=3364777 RepID=UPI0036DDB610
MNPVQALTVAATHRIAGRLRAGVARMSGAPSPHAVRNDAYRAAALLALSAATALTFGDGRRPDTLGWALLTCGHVPLAWRRARPLAVLLAVVAFLGPYHALAFRHSAGTGPAMVALYTVAVTGTARRTLITGACVVGLAVTVNALVAPRQVVEILRISGWIISVLLLGGYVRVHRQYVASVVERAERAERTREEEARRRVAEERLRIARDLHDLLAHSITLIGVQTSVAAHVLAADPERLDRKAVARALDDIAETCRAARGELRGTLEVLREPDAGHDGHGPLPTLAGVADLVSAARGAGARVELTVEAGAVPSAVGAAAFRIAQEALTNAVRHGGADARIRVALRAVSGTGAGAGTLRVAVTDDGAGAGAAPAAAPGFGLVGMRERARSVGGTLHAGPRAEGGFEVTAVLPLAPVEGPA